MNEYQRGDIILVRFPFTDFTSYKLRPALILSVHAEDFVIIGIFSQVPEPIKDSWVIISEEDSLFSKTGLKKKSVIKCEKIAVIHKSVVKRKIGILPSKLFPMIDRALKKALFLKS